MAVRDSRGGGVERIVVATLGDSITAGSPLSDPDPAAAGGSRPPTSGASGTGRPPASTRGSTSAITASTGSAPTRSRPLDAAVAGASVLVVEGGINDIVQGRPAEDAAAALGGMVERGRRFGLAVRPRRRAPMEQRRRARRRRDRRPQRADRDARASRSSPSTRRSSIRSTRSGCETNGRTAAIIRRSRSPPARRARLPPAGSDVRRVAVPGALDPGRQRQLVRPVHDEQPVRARVPERRPPPPLR